MTPDPQQNLTNFGRTVTTFFLGGIGLVVALMLWTATIGQVGG